MKLSEFKPIGVNNILRTDDGKQVLLTIDDSTILLNSDSCIHVTINPMQIKGE